jgi:predicted O-methyltransferase YrrM
MSQALWTAVDHCLVAQRVPEDSVLAAAVADSAGAGLPEIQVTPNLGKLLHLLARLVAARSILEIGTLGGYSTIWVARALPEGGRLVTLESDEKCAAVARANLHRAGLDQTVELRLGRALDTLPQLAAENRGPFDLVFIDADKENTPAYFEWALKLARVGRLIIVDNVVRGGAVLNASSPDPNIHGIRRFFEIASDQERITVTAIQTVGSKVHDGLALAVVTGPR